MQNAYFEKLVHEFQLFKIDLFGRQSNRGSERNKDPLVHLPNSCKHQSQELETRLIFPCVAGAYGPGLLSAAFPGIFTELAQKESS